MGSSRRIHAMPLIKLAVAHAAIHQLRYGMTSSETIKRVFQRTDGIERRKHEGQNFCNVYEAHQGQSRCE